jgi:hypothetical protein
MHKYTICAPINSARISWTNRRLGSGYNYDRTIPKWVNTNYPRTSVYDDAQVNVLEEDYHFKWATKVKELK